MDGQNKRSTLLIHLALFLSLVCQGAIIITLSFTLPPAAPVVARGILTLVGSVAAGMGIAGIILSIEEYNK